MSSVSSVFDCGARLAQLGQQRDFLAKTFQRSNEALYQLLADCHELTLEIGSDSGRAEALKQVLLAGGRVTKRQVSSAKSVAAKVALYVFASDDSDFVNVATRSNYKLALEKASREGKSVEQLVSALKGGGLIAFIRGLRKKNATGSGMDAVESLRKDLANKTLRTVPSIDAIDGRMPMNSFVAVLFRMDGGRLVACLHDDSTDLINTMLAARLEEERKRKRKAGKTAKTQHTEPALPMAA